MYKLFTALGLVLGLCQSTLASYPEEFIPSRRSQSTGLAKPLGPHEEALLEIHKFYSNNSMPIPLEGVDSPNKFKDLDCLFEVDRTLVDLDKVISGKRKTYKSYVRKYKALDIASVMITNMARLASARAMRAMEDKSYSDEDRAYTQSLHDALNTSLSKLLKLRGEFNEKLTELRQERKPSLEVIPEDKIYSQDQIPADFLM